MQKEVINVKDFYRFSCKTKEEFSSQIHDETRFTVLARAVKKLNAMLLENTSHEECLTILKAYLMSEYNPKWFALDWRLSQQVVDDIRVFERFLDWLADVNVIEANVEVVNETPKHVVSSKVDLVVRFKSGRYGAFILSFRAADKSPGGKSVHTSTKTDLYAMNAKCALEGKYPGITVTLVYLTNTDDAANSIGEFVVSQTKRSNAFSETFDEFYEEDFFDKEALLQKVDEVLSEPVKPNCYTCPHERLCKAETSKAMARIKPKAAVHKVESAYVMPEYTESQMKVVTHVNGPMLVCAGPGSGKTATLIGRIRYLMEQGIDPEFILGITFTREAAGELKSRCQAFCEKGEMPELCTIHALGYKILRMNKRFVGKIELLTKPDAIKIIETVILEADLPPLKGLSYDKLRGKGGLYDTLFKLLESYKLLGSEKFLAQHKELDRGFLDFADLYFQIVRARGFITFDEQISKCLWLFKKHPEVLEGLRRRYKYIMVDEFQDVDARQVQFIYSIAEHKNLVVVGDDDQSIYSFRGGSNQFMLDFKKDFPEAKTVVLEENFRSTKELVEVTQAFIKKSGKRLDKKIKAVRPGGMKPTLIKAKDACSLEKAVSECLDEGYEYRDISVLASKNATLEDLYSQVSFPCVLGKSFLIDSAYFGVLLDVLHIYYAGMDDAHKVHLKVVLEEDEEAVLSFLDTCFERIERNVTPLYLCDYVAQRLRCEDTAVTMAMEKVVEQYHITDNVKFYETLFYMSDFADDTRLEPDTSKSVLLTTSHESKGMEWPVVIMIDDFRDDGHEETRRLYYVAMTRPKDRLIVLSDKADSLIEEALAA